MRQFFCQTMLSMQFDAGVWPCIEAVWKTFHNIFFQDLLMVGHAQNGCNLRFLPTLRSCKKNMKSVAHHELHAQGTKHFGLWYDVSTFTFLHSGSGKYFENETFAAKMADAKQHAGNFWGLVELEQEDIISWFTLSVLIITSRCIFQPRISKN